jgi:hypothetical protein
VFPVRYELGFLYPRRRRSLWSLPCKPDILYFLESYRTVFHFVVLPNIVPFHREHSSTLLPTPNLDDHISVFMYQSEGTVQYGINQKKNKLLAFSPEANYTEFAPDHYYSENLVFPGIELGTSNL